MYALDKPGDVLFYEYGPQGTWCHRLVLEERADNNLEERRVACSGGARGCPPESLTRPEDYGRLLLLSALQNFPEFDNDRVSRRLAPYNKPKKSKTPIPAARKGLVL